MDGKVCSLPVAQPELGDLGDRLTIRDNDVSHTQEQLQALSEINQPSEPLSVETVSDIAIVLCGKLEAV